MLTAAPVGRIAVPWGSGQVTVDILSHGREPTWVLLRPEDERFFAGVNDPYAVGATPAETAANLRRDALFFGAAVANSLAVLATEPDWTLLLQDWEAATVALALAGKGGRQSLHLTLHNTYDSGAVADGDLLQVGIDPERCPGPAHARNASVLERGLPRVERPVLTVSRQFAQDMIRDDLQTHVLAPHLQALLRAGVQGIDNGTFTSLQIPPEVLAATGQGRLGALTTWKQQRKQKAIEALAGLTPSSERPIWGEPDLLVREDAPWLVLGGRDDPLQKGYDVAALAVAEFLQEGGDAKFLFFPIPGSEGLAGLGFLAELARSYPRQVLVLPFLWREGFAAALQGAAFGVMPSLYEPFGMANEFYLNGTCAIARATGGLVQQIVPLRDTAVYTSAVGLQAIAWHQPSAQATGLLYREPDDLPSAVQDWRQISATAHRRSTGTIDRLQERRNLALFRAMGRALCLGMQESLHLWRDKPEFYTRMVLAGLTHVQRMFSWERTAHDYLARIGWQRGKAGFTAGCARDRRPG
jgi:glycogen synthase